MNDFLLKLKFLKYKNTFPNFTTFISTCKSISSRQQLFKEAGNDIFLDQKTDSTKLFCCTKCRYFLHLIKSLVDETKNLLESTK